MTLHLYTALRAWPLIRQAPKDDQVSSGPARPAQEVRSDRADAIIYAAGIACAGQVAERLER